MGGNTSQPSGGEDSSGGVAMRTALRDIPSASSLMLASKPRAYSSMLNLPPPVTVSVKHAFPFPSVENLQANTKHVLAI